MGYFRPSHALSVEELTEAGVKDLERLTQPYIRQVRHGKGTGGRCLPET
jgi:hypothetical protein